MLKYYIAVALRDNKYCQRGQDMSPGHPTEEQCLEYMIENFEGHLMFEVKKIYIIEEDTFVDSE